MVDSQVAIVDILLRCLCLNLPCVPCWGNDPKMSHETLSGSENRKGQRTTTEKASQSYHTTQHEAMLGGKDVEYDGTGDIVSRPHTRKIETHKNNVIIVYFFWTNKKTKQLRKAALNAKTRLILKDVAQNSVFESTVLTIIHVNIHFFNTATLLFVKVLSTMSWEGRRCRVHSGHMCSSEAWLDFYYFKGKHF